MTFEIQEIINAFSSTGDPSGGFRPTSCRNASSGGA